MNSISHSDLRNEISAWRSDADKPSPKRWPFTARAITPAPLNPVGTGGDPARLMVAGPPQTALKRARRPLSLLTRLLCGSLRVSAISALKGAFQRRERRDTQRAAGITLPGYQRLRDRRHRRSRSYRNRRQPDSVWECDPGESTRRCSFPWCKVVTDLDELSAIPREVESYLP
jgi:hypothetical protein